MNRSVGLAPHDTAVFWGEIAPCEHIAQFYDDDNSFLRRLAGFVSEGLRAGETAIVIATPEHGRALRPLVEAAGIDLTAAIAEDRYIALDAEETLSLFMVSGWPDEQLFADLIAGLIGRGSVKNRRVRAFGEMVALLWARGQAGATVRLEHLWNQFCRSYAFPLFCAYPKAGFTKRPMQSLSEICVAHSKLLIDDADDGSSVPAAQAAD